MDRDEATYPASGCSTDEELMQAVQAQDQASFNLLVARYRLLIGKIVTDVLPRGEDAEEAIQDVFLEVWNRASRYDVRKGKPLGWLICIARRRAIDHYRKIQRRADFQEKLYQNPIVGYDAMSADLTGAAACDEQVTTNELRRLLDAMIDTLPTEQGRVIHLSFFRDMSQRQVAAYTGTPLGTIKTRLALGLSKLAQKSLPFRQELS